MKVETKTNKYGRADFFKINGQECGKGIKKCILL